jgi:hypothetical protein
MSAYREKKIPDKVAPGIASKVDINFYLFFIKL